MLILPNEILREIFLHLHRLDKIKCLLVCHHWNRVMQQFALCHTFSIYSVNSLNKLLDKIQEDNNISDKIERLIVEMEEMSECSIAPNALFLRLPNLQALIYTIGDCPKLALEDVGEYPWKETVKYITDYSEKGKIFKQPLPSGVYSRLTTIKVNRNIKDYSVFKNASVLTNLELVNIVVNLNSFEVLHNNLPLLKRLEFHNPNLIMSTKFNWDIEPATSIIEFVLNATTTSFFEGDIMKQELNLLKYIRIKYTNLSALTHSVLEWDGDGESNDSDDF